MVIKADDPAYNYAFNVLMNHEGVESDDPDDSGGLTRYGITLQFLIDKNIDVNKDGIIDLDDIKAIDYETARKIYFYYFWIEYQYWRIVDLDVATKTMDYAVNMGEETAHKLLQRAVNNLTNADLEIDGELGNLSFAAINKTNPGYLKQEMRDLGKAHYLDIIKRFPKNKKFEKGWLKRAAW